MARTSEPTETSPLLSGGNQNLTPVPPTPIGPENAAALENSNAHDENDDDDLGDGADLERQTSNISTISTKKSQGLPDVRKRMIYIFPAIALGVFMAAADQTLVVTTYGTIGTDLQALNSTSWIATSYFLTLSCFQPIYGKLSDIFGRKSCLLVAYAIFGLGSTFCGLARSIEELIAARAFAGIGGGGMSTVVSIIMSDVLPLRERGEWQGYINVVYAVGSSAGAPLGGLLAETVGWRWAFLAQGPLCVVAIVAVGLALQLPAADHSHWREKLMKIDGVGAIVLIAATFGLLVGLDRGSNVGWSDKYAIAGLCATPLFGVFILVEKYVASHPFAPLRIIMNRSLFACYLCNFFAMGGLLSAMFYIPLYWQVMGDMSASKAGLLLLPLIISSVSGSLFSGIYMKKTSRYYWITVIGYTFLAIGLALLLLCAGVLVESIPLMIIGSSLASFGNGIGITTTLIGLISNAAHSDQAVATACSYLFRSLGSVFGVSMCATAFNSVLRKALRGALHGNKDAGEIAERVRESLEYFRGLEPGLKEVVRECYGRGSRAALGVSLGLVAGSAVCAWFVREKRLGK